MKSGVSFCASPPRRVKGSKRRGRREGGDHSAPSALHAACSAAHPQQAAPKAASCGLASGVNRLVQAVTDIFRGKCTEGAGKKCWSDGVSKPELC